MDTPSLMCPYFYALCGHNQWMMEPGKREPWGHDPIQEGSVTRVLSCGRGR